MLASEGFNAPRMLNPVQKVPAVSMSAITPGDISIAEDIKFSDMPGGTIASWAALPNLAWLQIVLVVAVFDNSVFAQDPSKAPGDVADGTYVGEGSIWVR